MVNFSVAALLKPPSTVQQGGQTSVKRVKDDNQKDKMWGCGFSPRNIETLNVKQSELHGRSFRVDKIVTKDKFGDKTRQYYQNKMRDDDNGKHHKVMEEPHFKSRWSEQQCKTLEAMRLLDLVHKRMVEAERRLCLCDWGK